MAITFTGSACTQRINGDESDTQDFCVFQNARGSTKLVHIRRLTSQLDAIAASSAVMVPIFTYRGVGNPNLEGAARANKCKFNTTQSSDAFVNLLYAVTPDGSGISGLSGTAGVMQWRQWLAKMRTIVEQVQGSDSTQLPTLVNKTGNEFTLRPGEYLLIRADPIALVDNNNSNGWIINCVWQEEDLPSYTISGNVTLSGTGVVGAEVTVIVADDNLLTNAYLLGVYTTIAAGAWSASIPNGKIAYVTASNESAGTFYTAEGRPFIS